MPLPLSKKLNDELRKTLIKEEGKIKKRIEELKKEDPFADPDHANDNAAVDTDVREQVGHETIEAQVATLSKKLELVKLALKKIINNKYGFCESCLKPISVERLQFLPEAKYCITCERRLIK